MGQRDAFGREIRDAPPRASAPDPKPARSVGSGARTAASLAAALLIVAGIAALVVVGLGGKTQSAGVSDASSLALPSAGPPTTAAKPAAATVSLLSRGAIVYALARLRGHGRLRLLRVARDRIDAQLVTRGGALRNIQVTADSLRDFGAAGSGARGLPTIPLAEVDPAAPAQIARAAARRAGRRPSRVDYLVLLTVGDAQSWNVYLKPDGLHFMAGRHGEGLRKL